MSFTAIALFIAGGAALTAILAAGAVVAKEQRDTDRDEQVVFEARSSLPVWVTLAIGALDGLMFAFSSSITLFLMGLSFVLYWPHAGRVLLRVREHSLDHLAPAGGSQPVQLGSGRWLSRISAEDVERLEWDGFDNAGICLRNGDVVSVNHRLALREQDREPAKLAILAFVARAARSASPAAKPPLDVAPWVVRSRGRVRA